MRNVTERSIGDTYFVREESIYLVEVVSQRDDPPGRPDRTAKKTLLAGHTAEVAPQNVAGVIAQVGK